MREREWPISTVRGVATLAAESVYYWGLVPLGDGLTRLVAVQAGVTINSR